MNRAHATPRAHFTKVPVTMARDPTLSLKAKGLGCLLRSFPGGWEIHRSYVERFTSDGRDAVRGAFRELTAAGHLVERRPRDPKRSDLPHGGLQLRADRREAPSADERFVMIRNAALRDPTLSLKAKGLLVVLLSFPPRSPMSIQALTAHTADGKASIATAMRELERAGYVHRRPQARKADGTYANTTRLATDRPTNTSEDSRGAAREPRTQDATRAATGGPPSGEAVTKPAVTGEPRRGEEAVTGEPRRGEKAVAGKPRRGENAVQDALRSVAGFPAAGEPAAGKPAPKKIKNQEDLKQSSSQSSSSRRARARARAAAAAATTASRGEGQGLTPEIAKRLKGLLAELLAEDARRRAAWSALDPQAQTAAYRRAQARKADPAERRAFATLLKEELDEAAGLDGEPRRQTTPTRDPTTPHLDTPARDDTTREERSVTATGLDPQVRAAIGERLLADLYREDPQRRPSWENLPPTEQRQALRAARAAKNEAGESRAFRTVLKLKLDEAARRAQGGSRPHGARKRDPVEASRVRNEVRSRATAESEAAFDAALEAGLTIEEASVRAAVAYQAALTRPDPPPAHPAAPTDEPPRTHEGHPANSRPGSLREHRPGSARNRQDDNASDLLAALVARAADAVTLHDHDPGIDDRRGASGGQDGSAGAVTVGDARTRRLPAPTTTRQSAGRDSPPAPQRGAPGSARLVGSAIADGANEGAVTRRRYVVPGAAGRGAGATRPAVLGVPIERRAVHAFATPGGAEPLAGGPAAVGLLAGGEHVLHSKRISRSSEEGRTVGKGDRRGTPRLRGDTAEPEKTDPPKGYRGDQRDCASELAAIDTVGCDSNVPVRSFQDLDRAKGMRENHPTPRQHEPSPAPAPRVAPSSATAPRTRSVGA